MCPNFKNIITSNNTVSILCCDKKTELLHAKNPDDNHLLNLEYIEDEMCITSEHEMKKKHYISFIAFVQSGGVNIIKLYPEWNMEIRVPKQKHLKIFYYCTNDGLFLKKI